MTDTTDFFVPVPQRVVDALVAREITFRQFGMLVYLIAEAGYPPRPVRITMAELKAALGLSESSDSIGRDLKVLLEQGWIEFEPRQGRWLYRITLRKALRRDERQFRTDPADFRTKTRDSEEVNSAPRKSTRGPKHRGKRASAEGEPPQPGSPRSRSKDLDSDDGGEPCVVEGCEELGTKRLQWGGVVYCRQHGARQSMWPSE